MKKSQSFLTKSRFVVADEFAAKLNYLNSPEYGNTMAENDFMKALVQINQLLNQENVVIFEAAIQYKELLYNKTKAKKIIFEIKDDYKSYLQDVVNQSFALQRAFRNFKISKYLMVADKECVASVAMEHWLYDILKVLKKAA